MQEKILLGGDHSITHKNKPNDASSETTIKCYRKKMRYLVELNVA